LISRAGGKENMTVKMLLVFLISLAAVMIAMPPFIKYLQKLSFRQSVSEYALEDDKKKAGTPIMGGILFIIVPIVVSLISSPKELTDMDTWIVFLAYAGYGVIGFIDDYLIAVKKNNDGLTPIQKFSMQVVLAAVFFLIYRSHAQLSISLPFVSHQVNLGWGYFILVLFMFAGSSNAVNLTDGMDGLSSGVTILALIPYTVICVLQQRVGLSVFCCSLLGALLGYLYFNKKPARVFMGDTGALALGGVLAGLAMITKTELLLIIIAGVPVIETVCVLIQQVAVRTGHKKVFIYTPIHYAFRIKGMPETHIVEMFWAVEAVFALAGLLIYLF
jgi:phospho-N-acetylmuramoyl-pentapeptide-transferase